jgi:ABC-type uncharacterized transport system auxiliary subunit
MCVVVALGMLGMGAGCTSSSDSQRRAVEQKRTYLLEVNMPAEKIQPAQFSEIKVRAFKSLPPFNSLNIVVKRANGETVMDFYNSWIAPPHDLVRVQTTRYLEKIGLFNAVYDSASGTVTSLGLEGMVSELFLDFRGEKPAAVVTLRLVVLDERAPDFTVLWSAEKTGRAEYDAEGRDVIIRAFAAALTQVLEMLALELWKAPLPK